MKIQIQQTNGDIGMTNFPMISKMLLLIKTKCILLGFAIEKKIAL